MAVVSISRKKANHEIRTIHSAVWLLAYSNVVRNSSMCLEYPTTELRFFENVSKWTHSNTGE